MKATLFDYTGYGTPDPARHAANVLIFTKSTRLNMTPDLMQRIAEFTPEKVREELEYMANTIPSSWEFCSYSFLIEGVSRGFTHQFVRTRTGAYAQQTMRILDMGADFDYITGPSIECDGDRRVKYDQAMFEINQFYRDLIDCGAEIEDARGVLPTNISTNICAHFSLRTLADLFRKRASSRTQHEYHKVIDAMKAAVLEAHPWAELFFNRTFDVAAADLEREIIALGLPLAKQTQLVKFIDQMRMQA